MFRWSPSFLRFVVHCCKSNNQIDDPEKFYHLEFACSSVPTRSRSWSARSQRLCLPPRLGPAISCNIFGPCIIMQYIWTLQYHAMYLDPAISCNIFGPWNIMQNICNVFGPCNIMQYILALQYHAIYLGPAISCNIFTIYLDPALSCNIFGPCNIMQCIWALQYHACWCQHRRHLNSSRIIRSITTSKLSKVKNTSY